MTAVSVRPLAAELGGHRRLVGRAGLDHPGRRYAFARLRFLLRNVLFLMIISTLMVPVQVLMITQFQVVIDLNLLNSTRVWCCRGWPRPSVCSWPGRSSPASPGELIEVARIDGASRLRIFASIALPLSETLVVTLVIFTFSWRWNELVWPLVVLTDADALPAGVQFLVSQYGSDFGPLLASSFPSILPMLVVFSVFQKYFGQWVDRTGLT